MHFSGEGHVHVELIDPESGALLPFEDQAEGELVYTSLRREAMPVLRFRSRDRVVVNAKPCSCGRGAAARALHRPHRRPPDRPRRQPLPDRAARGRGGVRGRPDPDPPRARRRPPGRAAAGAGRGRGRPRSRPRRARSATRSAAASSSPRRSSSSPTARCRGASTRAGWWTSASRLRGDAEQRRVAVGALDHVVGRAVREQPAVAHAEVAGLRVVGDQRERGLLGLDRVAAGELDADVATGRAGGRPCRARTARARRGSPMSSGGPGWPGCRGPRGSSSAATRPCPRRSGRRCRG